MPENISGINSLTSLISHLNLKNIGFKGKDDVNNITDELSGTNNNKQDLLEKEILALMDIEQMAQLPE